MFCKIIPEKCIACGLCQIYAPDIFDYNSEGIVLLKKNNEALTTIVSKQNIENLLLAYRKCPVHAIEIEKNKIDSPFN